MPNTTVVVTAEKPHIAWYIAYRGGSARSGQKADHERPEDG
jgi:hypothetical protein